jgi:hypothetical protein
MAAIFVQLSDIHFGQERDGRIHIHNDVKKQFILDAAEMVRHLPGGVAHGILVSGNIASSGSQVPYTEAGTCARSVALRDPPNPNGAGKSRCKSSQTVRGC